MKQSKYLILISVAIITLNGLNSCKKQLDLQPPATLNESNAIVSIEDVKAAVYGAYAEYGTYVNNIYVSALLSDENKLGPNNSGGGALEYRYQFGSDATSGGDVTAAWGGYYRVIDQVNRTLPKIPNVTATTVQEPLRNYYKAQLLALRGMAHFELLQAYSPRYNPTEPLGVPIMLASDPLGKPARNNMGDVMTQINADLEAAKAALPAVTASDFTDTLLNPISIAAYQARIALYRNDYDAAIAFATEVINSNVKPLASGTDFQAIWTNDSESEVLFKIDFTGATMGNLWNTSGGQILISPSDKLVASYDAADIRRDTYIGDAGSDHYVNKYLGSSAGFGIVDLIVARTAEMYLIRAEANAKKSGPDIAAGAADLNLLRSNRIFGYTDETFTTAQDLIDAVIEERYKELAFEGFRYFDLKRNDLPVQRDASDVVSSEWQTMPVDSKFFILPIPSSELLANPNMVQNPGY